MRRAIADGEAKPGERLPPAKDPRRHPPGQHQLRDEGLLEFRRGRGITITGTAQQSALVESTKDLIHYARTQGYKPDELIHIIQQLA